MSNKEMATEKRLKVRLYLSLLVYTVVGYGLTLILDYIFSKFDNGIFAWLYWRLDLFFICLLYTSPSPRDQRGSRMPSSA